MQGKLRCHALATCHHCSGQLLRKRATGHPDRCTVAIHNTAQRMCCLTDSGVACPAHQTMLQACLHCTATWRTFRFRSSTAALRHFITSPLCAASRAAGMSSIAVPRLSSAARRTSIAGLSRASCSKRASVLSSWDSCACRPADGHSESPYFLIWRIWFQSRFDAPSFNGHGTASSMTCA